MSLRSINFKLFKVICTLRQTGRKIIQNCCRSFCFCFKAVSEARTHWHLNTLTLSCTHTQARTFQHALHWLRSLILSRSFSHLRCCWGYCCYYNRIKSNIYDAQTTESCQSFALPPPYKSSSPPPSISLSVWHHLQTHTHTKPICCRCAAFV